MNNLYTTLLVISVSFSGFSQSPYFVSEPQLQGGFVCFGSNAVVNAAVQNTDQYQLEIQGENGWSEYGGINGNASGGGIQITLNNYQLSSNFRIRIWNIASGETNYSQEFFIHADRPEFTVQPVGQAQCYDGDVIYNVDDFGSGYSYQWQKAESLTAGFTNLSAGSKYKDVNTAALTLKSVKTTDNDFFRCVVTGPNGCENTSLPAALTINYLGTLKPVHSSTTFCEGQPALFEAGTISGMVESYTWTPKSALGPINLAVQSESLQGVTFSRLSADFEVIELSAEFTQNLMNSNGSLSQSTCYYTRERGPYIVHPMPAPPVLSGDSVCGSGVISLQVENPLAGNYFWHADSTQSSLSSGHSFNTSNISVSTSYFARYQEPVHSCYSDFATVLAKVNPLPQASFGTIEAICPSETSFDIPFTSLSEATSFEVTLSEGVMNAYQPYDGNLDSGPISVPLPLSKNPGTYGFDLLLTNSVTGCQSDPIPVSLRVKNNTAFTLEPEPQTVCEGEALSLHSLASGEGAVTYQWFFENTPIPDQLEENLNLHSVEPDSAGTYFVQATSECNSISSGSVELTVNPLTRIVTEPEAQSICEGEEALFTAVATGTGELHYQWFLAEVPVGVDSDTLLLEHLDLTNHGSAVYCQVTGECGQATSREVLLTVFSRPAPPAVSPVGYCQNTAAQPLTAVSLTGHTLHWYDNSSAGAMAEAPVPATSQTGTFYYYVSQTDANLCESDRAEISVEVSSEVEATLSSSALTVCSFGNLNKEVLFTVNGQLGTGNYAYQWLKEGEEVTGESGNEYTGNGAGSYGVRVNSGFCSIEKNITITAVGQTNQTGPSVRINGLQEPYLVCPGTAVELEAVSQTVVSGYRWYSSESSSTALKSSAIFTIASLSAPRTYYASTTQEYGFLTCETERTPVFIDLYEEPAISVSVREERCAGSADGALTFTPLSPNTPYSFRINGGDATSENVITNLISGNYSIEITDSKGCISSSSATVGQGTLPVFVTEPANQNNCKGNTVNFEVQTAGNHAFQWQRKIPGGDWEDISGEISNNLKVSSVGNTLNPHLTQYRAVAGTGSCQTFSKEATLFVNAFIAQLEDQVACEGETVIFSPPAFTGTATSYEWQRRIGTSGSFITIQNDLQPDLTIASVANSDHLTYYKVKVSFDKGDGNTCLETSDQGKLNVTLINDTQLSGDTVICAGDQATLKAFGCNGQVLWSSIQSGNEIKVYPLQTTIYTAICQSEGCSTQALNEVKVIVKPGIPAPKITATQTEICFGETATLEASNCLGNLLWSDGQTESSIEISPVTAVVYSATCSSNGCMSPKSNDISLQGFPELKAGAISGVSGLNCSGYNPPAISSTENASGGKGVIQYSWEFSENCTAAQPDWQTIPDATAESYNPAAMTQTTCFRRKAVDECGAKVYSNIHTIEIAPDPVVSVEASKDVFCSGEEVELHATITGGAGTCQLIWQRNLKSSSASSSFWEDLPQTGNSITLTDLENTGSGIVTVYYRAVYDCDLSNCNKATSVAVEIKVNPVLAIQVTASRTEICEGEEVTLNAGGCNSALLWSSGETESEFVIIPSSTSWWSATCTAEGCDLVVKDSVEIIVKPGIPAPEITASQIEICFGETATLNALNCTGDLLWSDGQMNKTIQVSPVSAVVYSATCSSNGCTSPKSNEIGVRGFPELKAGEISGVTGLNCSGYNPPAINSSENASGGKGVIQYSWEFSENCTLAQPDWQTIPDAISESYNPAALTKTTCFKRKSVDECGAEVYSNIQTIEIAPDPAVTIQASKYIICSGEEVELNAEISGGAGTCQLIWQRNLKSSSASSSFWEDLPQTGNSITLTDLENTGSGIVTVYYRAVYDCDLSNCNKATSVAVEIKVNPVLAIQVTASRTEICEGEEVTLNAGGCNSALLWSSGETESEFVIIPSSTSWWSATCTAEGCDLVVKDSVEIIVKPGIPAPEITASQIEICFGETATLNALNCTGDLLWSDGQMNKTIQVSPVSAVVYSATCSSNGCTSPKSNEIGVRGFPELKAGEISGVTGLNCSGYNPPAINSSENASGGKGVIQYSWEFLENCTAAQPDWQTIPDATSESYNPAALTQTTCFRRKAVDECGAEVYSNIQTIEIAPDPAVTIQASKDIICSGEEVELNATISGGAGTCQLIWQRNLKSSSASSSFWEDLPQTGNSITLTDLENTGSGIVTVYYRAVYDCDLSNCNKATSVAVEIKVNPVLAIQVTASRTEICEGEEVTLNAGGCNSALLWSSGETESEFVIIPSSTSWWSATCTAEGCDLVVKDSVEIIVKPGIPAPEITASQIEICFGETATLNALNCTGDLLWSDGRTESSIEISPVTAVVYSATCSSNGCTSPKSNEIELQGFPELKAGAISGVTGLNCSGYNPPAVSSIQDASGGKGVIRFSWEFSENCTAVQPDWQTIPYATSESYNPAALTKSTCFRRKAVDECGAEVYSNIQTIEIAPDPAVTIQASKDVICSGEEVELNAEISGGAGTCQLIWQRNLKSSSASSSFWEDLSQTGNSKTLTDMENTGSDIVAVYYRAVYDCDLSNCNKATSAAISIEIRPSDQVALNVTDTTVCTGLSIELIAGSCAGDLLWEDGSSDASRKILVSTDGVYTATCSGTCGTFSATANIKTLPGLEPPVNTTPFTAVLPDSITFAAIGNNLRWYSADHNDSVLSVTPIATETGQYTFWVSQSNGQCESPRLAIHSVLYAPLTITRQPFDQYDCEGNSVYFEIEAIGAGKLNYQWQRKKPTEDQFTVITDADDGIKFANQPFLRVSAVGDADNPNYSQYRCVVFDSLGAMVSEAKTLYANVIYRTLPNIDLCEGQDFKLRLRDYVSIEGNAYAFQWQVRDEVADKWVDIVEDYHVRGSTSENLEFFDVRPEHGRKYRCRVFFNTGGYECIENTDQTTITIGKYPTRPPDLFAEYCKGQTTKTLSFNARPHADIWYFSNDEEAVGTGKPPKPSSDSAGVFTWWFSAVSSEKCASPKAKYTVTVHEIPDAPASLTPAYVMEPDTLIFDALGADLKWYTSRTGKKFDFNRPVYTKVGAYDHYISQTNEAGCESDRTHIEAEILGSLGFKKPLSDLADCEGNSVRFYANAKGLDTLHFVWQIKRPEEKDFSDITGQTASSLLVEDIGSTENPHLSQFRVIVSDSTGDSTVSNAAYLFVNQINKDIEDQIFCTRSGLSLRLKDSTFQGMVELYQLQRQEGRSWLSVSESSIPVFDTLSEEIDSLASYRLRISFSAEGGGTCARSSNDFRILKSLSPESPGTLSLETIQYAKFSQLILPEYKDSLVYQFYFSLTDSTDLTDSLNRVDTSVYYFDRLGIYEMGYSLTNRQGCSTKPDTLKITVSDSLWATSKTDLANTNRIQKQESDSLVFPPFFSSEQMNCRAFPNPLVDNDAFNLYYSGIEAEQVQLFDAFGHEKSLSVLPVHDSGLRVFVNEALREGVYLLSVVNVAGKTCQFRLVKSGSNP